MQLNPKAIVSLNAKLSELMSIDFYSKKEDVMMKTFATMTQAGSDPYEAMKEAALRASYVEHEKDTRDYDVECIELVLARHTEEAKYIHGINLICE